jgi:hypothetical protein
MERMQIYILNKKDKFHKEFGNIEELNKKVFENYKLFRIKPFCY